MITLRLDKKGGINRGDINMIETDNKSDVYIIQLYKGEEVYNLTGKTVELSILEKKRGYGDTFDLPIYEATTGKIKLEVLEGMTKTDGLFYFQITVKDSTGLVDNFPIFPVEIKNSLKDDIIGTVVNSPYMQILLDAVAKAEGAVDIVNDIKTDYDTAKTNLQADYTQTKTALQKDYDTTKTSLQTDYVAIKNNIQSDYNATKTNIQNDYNSLRKVIMDENASAELQGQINDINSDLDTKAKDLSNRIDNIVSNAGDGTKDTEIIDARGGDTCLNNRFVGIENGEYIKEVSFEKIKKAKPKGEVYTIDNFSTWSKWSAVSGDVNKVTSLGNGGINISIEDALESNLVLSKSGVNLQGKKLTLKFDITVTSVVGVDDRFSIALNDSTTLKTVYLSEYKIGKTTTISIDFNDGKLTTGKLALVLNKQCNCKLENLKLEECMTIEGYQTLEEVITDVEELKLKSQGIKELVLPSVIPTVKEFETNIFWDNTLLNTNIKSVERIDIANSIGGRNNVMEDRWRIMLPSNTTNITQTFNVYFNDTTNISNAIKADIKVLDKNIGDGETRKIIFIGDSLTDNNVYEPELLKLFENDVMNIELLGSRGSAPNLHEGRAGWTTKHYCTATTFNKRTNGFLNPSTSKFDFSYYMNNQGYTSVDYVFINMGTNDLANSNTETVGYFTEMLNSIKAFNSNIVVFIGLCPPLSSRSDNYRLKNKRIELMKLLLNKFDKREAERILINPLVLNFDSYNGFPTQNVTGTRHNEDLKVVTDNTHPVNSEYYKMADTIYCSIKYAVSLGY